MRGYPDGKLTDAIVHTATRPGKYYDGAHGLFLRVDPSGARRWVQRISVGGKYREFGLGGYPLVTLAEAREKALANRRVARQGGDPSKKPWQARLAAVAPAPPASAISQPPDPHRDSFRGEDLFWIRLGSESAPAIYMLADPSCPDCAAALAALSHTVLGGDLQIRLALAPFLSRRSVDLATAIMREGDPAAAARRTKPGSPKGREAFAAGTDGTGSAPLSANLKWMRANGVSAVPHFVWSENGRWRQAGGVRPPAEFNGADIPGDDLALNAPAAVPEMPLRIPKSK